MASPIVLVHAQFPTVRLSYPGHSDLSTWVWVPCLEFPIDRVNQLQFSSKPLKWIRYCIGAVTGTQGHLSHNADSLDVVELVMQFEEAFDIQIPDEDAEKIKTVKDATDYIEQHQKAK